MLISHHTNEDLMVTQCNQNVLVLLAFKAFSVCGGRANSLELNCLELFMINKAGQNLFSKRKQKKRTGSNENASEED